MQLQNETIKERTPIKGLLIDWLIIFGTYLFIRVFFALFGLHQNIVILGCCLAVLPYLLGAVYLQKSHKQCPLWLSASAILIPSIVEKIAIYLFGAYLYNLKLRAHFYTGNYICLYRATCGAIPDFEEFQSGNIAKS